MFIKLRRECYAWGLLGCLLAGSILLSSCHSQGARDTSVVEPGKHVTMVYRLTVNGQVIDQATYEKPFTYTQGEAPIVPGLEKELVGLHAGEHKHISLSPQEGYGEVNREAVIVIPSGQLPNENMAVGNLISVPYQDGRILTAVIRAIEDDTVVLDFNHPLAGQQLEFDVEILSIS